MDNISTYYECKRREVQCVLTWNLVVRCRVGEIGCDAGRVVKRAYALRLASFRSVPNGVRLVCGMSASPGEERRPPVMEMAAWRCIDPRRL